MCCRYSNDMKFSMGNSGFCNLYNNTLTYSDDISIKLKALKRELFGYKFVWKVADDLKFGTDLLLSLLPCWHGLDIMLNGCISFQMIMCKLPFNIKCLKITLHNLYWHQQLCLHCFLSTSITTSLHIPKPPQTTLANTLFDPIWAQATLQILRGRSFFQRNFKHPSDHLHLIV